MSLPTARFGPPLVFHFLRYHPHLGNISLPASWGNARWKPNPTRKYEQMVLQKKFIMHHPNQNKKYLIGLRQSQIKSVRFTSMRLTYYDKNVYF